MAGKSTRTRTKQQHTMQEASPSILGKWSPGRSMQPKVNITRSQEKDNQYQPTSTKEKQSRSQSLTAARVDDTRARWQEVYNNWPVSPLSRS
jgi:hypothetical protein